MRSSAHATLCAPSRFALSPGEEAGGGADAMLDDGLIQRFSIERAYGLHLITTLPCAQASASAFKKRDLRPARGPAHGRSRFV